MKKYKKSLSLRMRLTLMTSTLLTLICAAFTVFSIYNANNSITSAALVNSTEIIQIVGPISTLTPSWEAEPIPFETTAALATIDTMDFSLFSFYFMIAVIISGSLLTYLVSGMILKPLKRLSDAVESIDRDALHTRIDDFHAGDEISTLSDSFNRMLERLNHAFDREKRFSLDAAHELKTPLTVMKTTVEVMDDKPSEEEYREVVEVLEEQTARMISLVEQLFALSSLKPTMKKMDVDLSALILEIKHELKSFFAENQVSLKTDLEDCIVRADRLLLKQAVTNLLQNAVKYGEKAGTVQISVKNEDSCKVIYVKDNGLGIPEEQREKIFEPFYRIDKSRARAMGGSGLGLAITKEIAEIHGGSITCSPNTPTGTIFRLSI